MTRTPAYRAAALAVAAFVLAGCLADAPTPSATPTPTLEPEPTATVTTYRLNTTVWYGGLVLTFGTATSTIDAKGGPVAVDMTIENPGAEDATLNGPIRLTADGRGIEPSRETVLPAVPAGGTAATTVVFEVDGAFNVPDSAIQVGRSEEHQAIVALVPGAAGTVTLEPVRLELTGKAQAGNLLVTVRAAELRADLPDWGLELTRGSLALTLTYDVANRSDFVGGLAFTTANLSLVLPDRRTISARQDGRSAPALLIRPGAVVQGLRSRFEVPAPGTGLYGLIVRDGAATKRIPLRIEITIAGP